MVTVDDCIEAEEIFKEDEGVQRALRERYGICDPNEVACDPWYYGQRYSASLALNRGCSGLLQRSAACMMALGTLVSPLWLPCLCKARKPPWLRVDCFSHSLLYHHRWQSAEQLPNGEHATTNGLPFSLHNHAGVAACS